MELTAEQLATLKTDAQSNQDTATLLTDGNLQGLADLYNAPASPAFVIWRKSVTQDEIQQNGFDWVRVDNLSVGKARIWEWLFNNESRSINPSKTSVRAGIDEVWKGTQADLDVRAAVYVHCKRGATRLEKVFATGTGSTASPAVSAVEGEIGYQSFIGM
ncbi:MAG: hypothetical protein ACYC2K_10070 [Gemmatimonadales bacterium]